jgi:hypothetical protein
MSENRPPLLLPHYPVQRNLSVTYLGENFYYGKLKRGKIGKEKEETKRRKMRRKWKKRVKMQKKGGKKCKIFGCKVKTGIPVSWEGENLLFPGRG